MTECIMRGVQNKVELYWANDLMAKVHSRDFFESRKWIDTFGMGYPGYDQEHTRIAVLNGTVIGALRLTTDTIRIGEARLKMGGFGYVTTAGEHRHKGISRNLIWDTMHYMRNHNYHVSMLFGIPNFYHKFGFATTLAEYATYIDTAEAGAIDHPTYTVRPGKPGDIPAIQKLHTANDDGTACTLLRSAAHITNRWENWKSVKVLLNKQGKLCAYFVPNVVERELHIDEIATLSQEDCGPLLYACAQEARTFSLPRIRFNAPPNFPFIRFLLAFKSTHEMRLERNSGGMMAFVDMPEALESMIPEWENLLQHSVARDSRCEVTLWVNQKPLRIRANMGAVDIAGISGKNKVSLGTDELMHLLTGYRYCEDILDVCHRIIDSQGRALLESIFPKRNPYVWKLDRF